MKKDEEGKGKEKGVKKVRIIFRDFIMLYVPCREKDQFPSLAGVLVFEHQAEFMPNNIDMAVYRSWDLGAKVGTGHAFIGYGNIARIQEDEEMIFTLNGYSHLVNLSSSARLHTAESSETLCACKSQIRHAITRIFGERAGEFNHNRDVWKCQGSGLFTLIGETLLPLSEDFIPAGWDPHE